jgi:hypothetical protein
MPCRIQKEMKLKSVVSTVLVSVVLALLPTSVSGAEIPGFDEPVKIEGPLKLFEPCEPGQLYSCIEYVGIINDEGKATEIFTAGEPETVSFPYGYKYSYTGRVYDWKTPNIIHENGREVVKFKAFHWPWGLIVTCYPNWQFPDRLVCRITDDELIIEFAGAPNNSVKYVVRVRTPKDWLPGWSVGAGKNGSLEFIKKSDGAGTLEIRATPALKSFYPPNTPVHRYYSNAEGRWFDPELPLKAAYTGTVLRSVTYSRANYATTWMQKCFADSPMSMWSNGLIEGYPYWDLSDRTLSVTLPAPHLKEDGSQNVGNLNFEIPIAVANCMWGIDLRGATQTTVSVFYPELGTTEVMTADAKVLRDIYYLSLSNFHYSSPTFKVKIVQTTATTKVVATKKTITCIKGKTTKKITGLNPKCPAGYKKK